MQRLTPGLAMISHRRRTPLPRSAGCPTCCFAGCLACEGYADSRIFILIRISVRQMMGLPTRQSAIQQTRQSALQPRVFAMIRLRIRRRLAGCVRVRFGHFNAVSLHA